MANNPNAAANLKPFVKGDPRINTRGRPKGIKQLQDLAKRISHEPVMAKGEPVVVNDKIITLAEGILRKWATHPNPRYQQLFMEYAYGKLPDTVEVEATLHDKSGLSVAEKLERVAAILEAAAARDIDEAP